MNGKGFSCGLCAAVALVCASLAFAELPIGTGIAFAAGSLGVWELRRETAGGRMRPASDTARRDVSPLLGEAEGGEIGGVVAQSAGTRRCGVSPRRHGGAGSSTSLGSRSSGKDR